MLRRSDPQLQISLAVDGAGLATLRAHRLEWLFNGLLEAPSAPDPYLAKLLVLLQTPYFVSLFVDCDVAVLADGAASAMLALVSGIDAHDIVFTPDWVGVGAAPFAPGDGTLRAAADASRLTPLLLTPSPIPSPPLPGAGSLHALPI